MYGTILERPIIIWKEVLRVDPKIFEWAKNYSSDLPSIKKKNIQGKDYVERIGSHISLYRSDTTNETLMCVYDEVKFITYWWDITNYEELRAHSPEIVDLLLRNGEYLCNRFNKGKGLKVVNLSYMEG